MPEVATPAPRVFLAKAGKVFTVAVRPTPDDAPSLTAYGDYITARTAARSLRWANGWKLVDEVDAATIRKAEEVEAARVEAKRWSHG